MPELLVKTRSLLRKAIQTIPRTEPAFWTQPEFIGAASDNRPGDLGCMLDASKHAAACRAANLARLPTH